MQYYKNWKEFLVEAPKDAKVLRSINLDYIKKKVPQDPNEEVRDYFARIQNLERTPPDDEHAAMKVFPSELVDWIEGLSDNYFPNNGRKMFAKWLGNAIYYEETEAQPRSLHFQHLRIYENDIRYLVDYLNGAEDLPDNLWSLKFSQMHDHAREWHENLKGVVATGEYETKEVVYNFENGFSIVRVPPEDLETEGEYMGHCVGGYCDSVSRGVITIYSLRDKKNRPHATIEVIPGRKYTLGENEPSRVEQIKGKGNDAPVEKYRPMIKQWLHQSGISYEGSTDYFNLLSAEEIKELLFGGKISFHQRRRIAAATKDIEVFNFLLEHVREQKEDFADVLVSLTNNPHLDNKAKIELLKINLTGLSYPILGDRTERLFRDQGPDFQRAAWFELKKDLLGPVTEEKLYYFSAFVNMDPNSPKSGFPPEISKEIMEHLLKESTLSEVADLAQFTMYGATLIYGRVMQEYLKSRNQDPYIVRKLYQFSKNPKTMELFGSQRLTNYIASSTAGLSRGLVEEMIKDIKENLPFIMPHRMAMALIRNTTVKDSQKIQLAKIYFVERIQPLEPGGLAYGIEAKAFARDLAQEAGSRYSSQFLKWLVHSGLLEPYFINRWLGRRSKATGKSIKLGKLEGKEKQQALSQIYDLRDGWLQEQLVFIRRYEMRSAQPDLTESVNKDIVDFFRKKLMTKDNFYDKVEGTLVEERGRSRQRGIYKFYCMISYGLTLEENKSRGLDDILADLRALPNVTIVTVVIKNQKISEGRYVAGLSLKFIPSIPGQFRSPEDVKGRIIRDIRRLGNVQSIFKVSAGLERLE